MHMLRRLLNMAICLVIPKTVIFSDHSETIRDYIVFIQTQLNVAEYTGVLISYWISFSVFIFAFQRSLSYIKFVRSIYSFDI